MFSDRIFQITLIVSLLAHAAIMIGIPGINIRSPEKQEKKVELRYIPKTELASKPAQKTALKPAALPKAHSLLLEKQELIAKARIEKAAPPAPNLVFTKPALPKPEIIGIKKKISLPPIDAEKINNPAYVNYYQILREKIRRAAYQNYNQPQTGEVYLSFTILSNGILESIKIVDEKSSAQPYLKDMALRSVKDAMPMPAFPKELAEYPRLSFNVLISVEIE